MSGRMWAYVVRTWLALLWPCLDSTDTTDSPGKIRYDAYVCRRSWVVVWGRPAGFAR